MANKFQSTFFYRSFDQALERLASWSINPWRRYSLLLIILLTGFMIGSSIGTINGVLALMDPIGAFLTVVFMEILIRLRRNLVFSKKNPTVFNLMDSFRIGLLYGLLLEGFKLL